MTNKKVNEILRKLLRAELDCILNNNPEGALKKQAQIFELVRANWSPSLPLHPYEAVK